MVIMIRYQRSDGSVIKYYTLNNGVNKIFNNKTFAIPSPIIAHKNRWSFVSPYTTTYKEKTAECLSSAGIFGSLLFLYRKEGLGGVGWEVRFSSPLLCI